MNDKERPLGTGESDRVNLASVDEGDANIFPAGADKEFEFSHLVLPDPIPFAMRTEPIERTWGLLSGRVQQVGGRAAIDARGKVAGPLVALAACAATFAAGIWVGAGRSGSNTAQVVSAEPVGPSLAGGNLGPSQRDVAVESSPWAKAAAKNATVGGGEPLAADGTLSEHEVPRALSAVRPAHGARATGNLGSHPAASAVPSPAHTSEALAAATAMPVGNPAWLRLANGGDYEGALVEITQAGGFERILESASAEQLMLLSDVARATGQQQRALAALRRIVSEHASDPVAPLAALNMGNLLDKMGDGAGATQAFAIYRALSPKGDFAEDALVRQIRSAVSAGQQDLAQRLVRQYEADFPQGRRADEVARWAEQIPTRAEAADAGAPSAE